MKINTRVSESRVAMRTLAALALLPLPTALMAQNQGGQLEEITVTAQRREQSLQDVGVSVSALDGDRLREMGFGNSLDIGRFAPGVVFASTAPGGVFSSLSIRGVSQSDFSPIQESPNATYLDEVYIAANGATSFASFDMERVEVLRGPKARCSAATPPAASRTSSLQSPPRPPRATRKPASAITASTGSKAPSPAPCQSASGAGWLADWSARTVGGKTACQAQMTRWKPTSARCAATSKRT